MMVHDDHRITASTHQRPFAAWLARLLLLLCAVALFAYAGAGLVAGFVEVWRAGR